MAREPDRHHGHRRHAGMELAQLAHGALEVRPVVEPGAQHDLRVEPDPGVGQAAEALHEVALDGLGAPEQEVPQHRVGGVHRDIEGREAEVDDALDLAVREVGQRDVVAVEERQPVVVVLDVEALAEALRQLVDEAEHALVGACRDLRRLRRLALETEVPAPLPLEHDRARASRPVDVDRELLLPGLDVEVDQVPETLPVHPQEPIARLEPGARGQPLGLDRQHPHPRLGDSLGHQRAAQFT